MRLDRDAKSIVGEADVIRQLRLGFGVAEVVAHVDEVGLLGLDPGHGGDGLLDGQVGRVVGISEGVENKHLDTQSGLDRLWRHGVAVGHVSEPLPSPTPENEAVCGHASVRKIDWNDTGFPKGKRTLERAGLGADVGPVFRPAIKCVFKFLGQFGQGVGGSVERDRFVLDFAEPPEVVESEDVIAVRVRIDDRVEFGDPLAQALVAEVGWGIDTERALRGADMDGRAQALVARIGGVADGTVASDHGNAMRCARS